MDIPEIGGTGLQPIELPDMRLFRVTRKKADFTKEEWNAEYVSMLETIDIWAHTVQYGDSSVLAFFKLVVVDRDTPNQRVAPQLKRVFAQWLDVEEIEVPKPMKSSIVSPGVSWN